jgi:hypothetical protein
MKEDSTARALGQEINAALHAQQALKQGMAGSLASMNLPTQDQLVALGERLGALEDAVARVEAVVVQLRHSLGGAAAHEVGRGLKTPRAVVPAAPPAPATDRAPVESPRKAAGKAPGKAAGSPASGLARGRRR